MKVTPAMETLLKKLEVPVELWENKDQLLQYIYKEVAKLEREVQLIEEIEQIKKIERLVLGDSK